MIWKVEIIFRREGVRNYTDTYYSDKTLYQEAIADSINQFNKEHPEPESIIYININAERHFM